MIGILRGYIIMGAEDDGTPIGVKQNMVKDMKRNFVNQLNNPSKMSPTLYLSIEDFRIRRNDIIMGICTANGYC